MSQTKTLEKVKTRFVFSNLFLEMCHNLEIHGRARQATDDNIIRRMHIACCTPKATDTHSEYEYVICNTYLFFHGNSGYANAFHS